MPYSDEFNGQTLDKRKWRDTFSGWQGRSPAKFVPSTISLSDGTLKIKNGILDPAQGSYTIAGGAVQSLGEGAHFGYYECRFKASQIQMSTTFWLSNGKELLHETTDCETDKYSQELDIVEVVGGRPGKFSENMNSNTHYRHIPCEQTKEVFHSAGSTHPLSSKVYEEYHTYACWWVDADHAIFYADDQETATVQFNHAIDPSNPFDRPMRVNMVTETYDWATPYPTAEELSNDNINTSYYDWVRCYQLVPVDESVIHEDHKFSIINGGFETGNMEGWTSWGGNPIEVVDHDHYSGDYAIHVVGAGAPEQVIDVKPNTEYTLTCQAKAVKGSISLGVKQGSSGTVQISENSYVKKTLSFTTDNSGSVKIYFYAPGSNDEGYADDFELIETNPTDSNEFNELPEIFTESISIDPQEIQFASETTLTFLLTYKSNTNRNISTTVTDRHGNVMATKQYTALAGYGKKRLTINLDHSLSIGKYNLKLAMSSNEGEQIDETQVSVQMTANGQIKILELMDKKTGGLFIYPNPVGDSLMLKGYSTGDQFNIYDLAGNLISHGVLQGPEIAIHQISTGTYLLTLNNRQSARFVKK